MFEAITYVLSKIKDGGLDKIVSSIEMKKSETNSMFGFKL